MGARAPTDDVWLTFVVDSDDGAERGGVPTAGGGAPSPTPTTDPDETGLIDPSGLLMALPSVPLPPPPELRRRWPLLAALVFGWLLVIGGVAVTSGGVAVAVSAHSRAEAAVAQAEERLDTAQVALGTIALTNSALAQRLEAAGIDVSDLEQRVSTEASTTIPVAPAEQTIGFSSIRLQYPVYGFPVTGVFGICRDDCIRRHAGVDMNAPSGTPIVAAAPGTVSEAGWLTGGAGYGVVLDHDAGWQTKYFHMLAGTLPVAVGDHVPAGAVIGWVGNTGNSARPHLHFEVEAGGKEVDPLLGFSYFSVGGPLLVDDPTDIASPSHIDDIDADPPSAEQATADSPLGAPHPGFVDLEEDLSDLAELVADRSPTTGALALMDEARETASAAIDEEREMLIQAGGLVFLGFVVLALGRGVVRSARSRLRVTA